MAAIYAKTGSKRTKKGVKGRNPAKGDEDNRDSSEEKESDDEPFDPETFDQDTGPLTQKQLDRRRDKFNAAYSAKQDWSQSKECPSQFVVLDELSAWNKRYMEW